MYVIRVVNERKTPSNKSNQSFMYKEWNTYRDEMNEHSILAILKLIQKRSRYDVNYTLRINIYSAIH